MGVRFKVASEIVFDKIWHVRKASEVEAGEVKAGEVEALVRRASNPPSIQTQRFNSQLPIPSNPTDILREFSLQD
jgi:hypothetical protein